MNLRRMYARIRKVPLILQSEAADCGLACVAMVAGFHGLKSSLPPLRARFTTSSRGTTLARLMQIARALNFDTIAKQLQPSDLEILQLPAVLHWNQTHFVVLERLEKGALHIVDPARGRVRLSRSEAERHFSGVSLEMHPSKGFRPSNVDRRLTFRSLFEKASYLPSALSKVLFLSLGLQIVALITPLYTQLVIDKVIPTGSLSALDVLALTFAVLSLLSVSLWGLRFVLVSLTGAQLQLDWSTRLFQQLVRLPLAFFEQRKVADILSRFRSLAPVQGLVASTMVDALVDGLMACATVALMFVYDPELAALSLSAVGIYALIRTLMYAPQRSAAHESLVKTSAESVHFVETLRAILAIKSFAREELRTSGWRETAVDASNSILKANMLTTLEHLFNQAVFGIETVAVIWLGTHSVVQGDLSTGMLIAFLAYKLQFTSRASALIDKISQFKLAAVHLDRFADIALSAPEDVGSNRPPLPKISGSLQVTSGTFSYSESDPPVLVDFSISIMPGESIGIIADSGRGKTTLLKILMGLLPLDKGAVLVDGHDIRSFSANSYRKQIASVMQEDVLLSGSIGENISFFENAPDVEWLRKCAEFARIDADIQQMPLRYQTLVGDMGAGLSGGQKQRILIARALYAQPRMLFLDEATSHLDAATESMIFTSIKTLAITRVVVAHRRETLALMDRIIKLEPGHNSGIGAAADPIH